MSPHKLVHYTEGGCWHGHFNQNYSFEWMAELEDLIAGGNPKASAEVRFDSTAILIEGHFDEQT
jgi:hypothetical protein